MQKILLSTTYFGPIQWYQKLYRAEEVFIEQWESFQKQTFRNRCIIATTNGIQALTVPIEGHASKSTVNNKQLTINTIKDLRISDHGNWRHLHWNALKSAYGESPFFDYYQDDIRPFFEQRWDYLLDFNEAIREKMCELIDILPKVSYTESWREECGGWSVITPQSSIIDYRMAINPKHPEPDPDFTPKRYYQVYEQKHGFLPNLSVLDLLFNMGPESIFYL